MMNDIVYPDFPFSVDRTAVSFVAFLALWCHLPNISKALVLTLEGCS